MSESPLIYKLLSEVVGELRANADGQLPGNMGGKAYIPAVEIANKTKALFYSKGIISIPNEQVIESQSDYNFDSTTGRFATHVTTRGEYTLIAIEDGSKVTISGIGEGTNKGSSVAANIASTNAFKNAFLRTFLITETSVEDEAKNGQREDAQAQPRAVAQAHKVAESDTVIYKGQNIKLPTLAGARNYLMQESQGDLDTVDKWAHEILGDKYSPGFISDRGLLGRVAVAKKMGD